MDDGSKLFAGGRVHPAWFWGITLVSVVLISVPEVSWLLAPITQFTTMIHEFGHALVCLLTGGSVSGMTIVSDGEGHGGLTFCRGGIPFWYSQTGYLGTAFFGAFLLYLSQFERVAKKIIAALGIMSLVCSVVFIGFHLGATGSQGFWSLVWGLAMGAFLLWAGIKWNPVAAEILLLFLAVQTALNSVTDIVILIRIYSGSVPAGTYSDASNMAQLTGIPALVWSLLWVSISVLLLSFTAWKVYGRKKSPVK